MANKSSPTNEDDPFNSLLSLEDEYYTEGYSLGVADGSRAGRVEGRLFGLDKGYAKAIAMGRLNGKARVWQARLGPTTRSLDHIGGSERVVSEVDDARTVTLKGGERVRRHVDRLVELTDPLSLETKNSEEAVNEFDERLAGAKSKATLIAKIAGESDEGSRLTATPAVRAEVHEGTEVEVTRSSSKAGSRSGGDAHRVGNRTGDKQKTTGEMEDFTGLPLQARPKKAA